MEGERAAPVKAGEIHEVSIDSVGGKGDGIAKVKGFVIFVPNVQKGDYVKIKITKVLPKVGFGEVVGKLDHPPAKVRQSRFVTINPEELKRQEPQEESHYTDSDDFGEG